MCVGMCVHMHTLQRNPDSTWCNDLYPWESHDGLTSRNHYGLYFKDLFSILNFDSMKYNISDWWLDASPGLKSFFCKVSLWFLVRFLLQHARKLHYTIEPWCLFLYSYLSGLTTPTTHIKRIWRESSATLNKQ